MSAVDSGYFDLEESGAVAIVRMTIPTIRHPPQAQQFSDDLRELHEKYKRTRIVVNLKGVHYMGSSAFAALFGLAKRLDEVGGKLALCEMDQDLLTGANILGLGTIVPIVPTEAEALALVSA
jgi:anti-sigma B factor antagonist